MRKTRFVFSIAVAALLVATPAMGPLLNYPIVALPAGDADGATSIGAGWGRGLNEDSGKLNAFGAAITRAAETVSYQLAGAYVNSSDIALKGTLAYHALAENIGIQGGIEWKSPDAGTQLNLPIGISFSGASESGSVSYSVMPRVQFTRTSGTTTTTETDFGASAGIGFVTEGGVGLALSGDWVSGTSSILVGAAVYYQLP